MFDSLFFLIEGAYHFAMCAWCFNPVDVIAIPPETVPERFGSFWNFPPLLLSHTEGDAEGLTVTYIILSNKRGAVHVFVPI